MNQFFEVRNKTDTGAELYFYGDIVSAEWEKWSGEDKCPAEIISALEECRDAKELHIYINSAGGNVFGGVAIYNMLKRHQGKKIVHVDGMAASIASVIAMAGDEIRMPSNTYLMIHNPWTVTAGNAEELRKTAADLDNINQAIVKTYEDALLDASKIEEIKGFMDAETWMDAAMCAQYFKNVVVEAENQSAACVTEFSVKNAPDGVKNLIKAAQNAKKEENQGENREKEAKNHMETAEIAVELDLITSYLRTEELDGE